MLKKLGLICQIPKNNKNCINIDYVISMQIMMRYKYRMKNVLQNPANVFFQITNYNLVHKRKHHKSLSNII